MGEELTEIPVPFLPSLVWYASYAGARLAGEGENEARRKGNISTALPAKEYTRTFLSEDMRLKVPLQGGSSAKHLPYSELVISGHGDWHRTHSGAFSALFGRSPYYRHLIDPIEEIYAKKGESGMYFHIFAEALHSLIVNLILPDSLTADWENLPPLLKKKALDIGKEFISGLNPDLSVISAVMKLGPDTVFPLLALSHNEERESKTQ